ncbi:hypothetical protein M123_4808 [Bacteroides fragilis str. 3976T8]|uniref:Uncharacterized protein n=1 Tax=Bacteroides fragilis str. 3976T8 TaxID=1339314 RepID=A0A016C460_BACFG|nr:hypothetical protein M123_4808 [Bacteroides fragilis str. 3976T8]
MRQYDKPVEAAHNTLVLPRAQPVDKPQQAFATILEAEELAVMQLQHLAAAILDIRDERGLRRVKRHHDIGLLPLQQRRERLPVPAPLTQVSGNLPEGTLVVVVGIVDT